MSTPSVRHTEPSMLLSLDDESWQPSKRLFDLSAQLAAIIPEITHPILSSRMGGGPRLYDQFPGEHYHLLTAICRLLKPSIVWEFGTDTGMSTVAMLEGLGPETKLYTVDIESWNSKKEPWLVDDDFNSGRVTQVISDMKAVELFSKYSDIISRAELIFVDGPKDDVTEVEFLKMIMKIMFYHNPIIIFDDIRLMNMLYIWRDIQRPKMDITSFGHWSGTGLVDWVPKNFVIDAILPQAEPSRSEREGTLQSIKMMNILMLCDGYPNYVPDLLLHGLRKLLGVNVVDYPRKDVLYEGLLGQPYLDKVVGLMADDSEVDRSDIKAKMINGFFDIVICDIRALNDDNRALLRENTCALALIDGEDVPAQIKPGNYVILRRETDGDDFSVPLPMALPVEIMNWIDLHAETPKTHSIAFLGSRSQHTPDRNEMLDELLRMFPDALIGSWDSSGGKWQGRDAYYHNLQSCKVVLSLPGAGYDTFRYWENAACSAAHVAKRMPLLIPNDYRDGREIIKFSDIRDLARTVERIVSDDLDWREFAARARRWLRAHHTTERRAQTTLDRLSVAFAR
jgi:predicted O-methyltransferase YrrM